MASNARGLDLRFSRVSDFELGSPNKLRSSASFFLRLVIFFLETTLGDWRPSDGVGKLLDALSLFLQRRVSFRTLLTPWK